MKKCIYKNLANDTSCSDKQCRYWVDCKEEKNCTFIAIRNHGAMSLRKVADIMNVSHVTVQNVQDQALQKVERNFRTKEEKAKKRRKMARDKELFRD